MKQTGLITLDNGNEIGLEFFPQAAPRTVENFVTLARKGFYNGLTFHRVVPGFVVQGGCPKGTGTGGPGYTIPAEFNTNKHVRGSLAMARSQHPDSAGSQFYITYGVRMLAAGHGERASIRTPRARSSTSPTARSRTSTTATRSSARSRTAWSTWTASGRATR